MWTSLPSIYRLLVLTAIVVISITNNASARRAIPDDNLSYPILITLKNGSSGSGFYLRNGSTLYLVTAQHVLIDPNTHKLLSDTADLLWYSKDLSDTTPNLLSVDLSALEKNGNLKAHPSQDIVVVKVAVAENPNVENARPTSWLPGITVESHAALGVTNAYMDIVKKFDDVLVGNDVILFGYPNSLGLQPNSQFDSHRPLLRKGIVAGKNTEKKSIILDCAAYQGNSGGPVIQIELDDNLMVHFDVIGVLTEFVPYADKWWNIREKYMNTNILNSGYSITVPMDFALDLTN